jgi:hypothetical protein
MGKSPGEDGLIPDLIKSAADAVNNDKLRGDNSVVDALTLLFNYVLHNEVWPARWSTGVIYPLHKSGDRLDPANYRPITLLSVVGKLFGRIIANRMLEWSEENGVISDEQGGFRPKRGTPDQIFLLRETLASRRERKLPTIACFVDARKAYDTVWREAAYVRIHEQGLNGKLWRQLQRMHENLTRTVRHPLGQSEPFPVERGVAQGAVESPWVYSMFIDELAKQLKNAGFGVSVAGKRLPLLMYADDIVLLANGIKELQDMMQLTSTFAWDNRFSFNGKKSAIMTFNANRQLRKDVEAHKWELLHEKVDLTEEYEYLGTTTCTRDTDWNQHVRKRIKEAKKKSHDLLWICRNDRGLRPRSAVTLWKSIVRPVLEYASEVWAGRISQAVEREVEQVQMHFLRSILGIHTSKGGVSNAAIRAELGCELITSRCSKQRLTYWRKLQNAPQDRLLKHVTMFRRTEILRSGGTGLGRLSSLLQTRDLLKEVGLGDYWEHETRCLDHSTGAWKSMVHEQVDGYFERIRAPKMLHARSLRDYMHVKCWHTNSREYSAFSGEVGRLGALVPERYLDDRMELKGTRLKMHCRFNSLPTMYRVGRECPTPWPKETRLCLNCDKGDVEDVYHFVMECPAYAAGRAKLHAKIERAWASSEIWGGTTFAEFSPRLRFWILLGKRIQEPNLEDQIDSYVKKFLRQSWNARNWLTQAMDKMLGRNYAQTIQCPMPI